jgi:outer membrane protein assembly factor BamB
MQKRNSLYCITLAIGLLLSLPDLPGSSHKAHSQPSLGAPAAARPNSPLPTGQFAWSTEKLFEMQRGRTEHIETMRVGNATLLGPDIFLPFEGVGYSDPVVANGVLYFSLNMGDAYLIARDAATGEKRWTMKRARGSLSPPLVVNDMLYVGTDGGLFLAVDLKTQREKWRHNRSDQSDARKSIVLSDGMIYYGATNGNFYALHADTGKVQWSLGSKTRDWSYPVVVEGAVYISDQTYLYKLDAKSGQEQWKLSLSKKGRISVVAGGFVYFVDSAGEIQTLDAAGGQLVRVRKGHYTLHHIAVAGQMIYFSGLNTGNIFAVDASTREVRWEFSVSSDTHCSSPTLVDQNLYATCTDGRLYAIDAGTGLKKWATTKKTYPMSNPVAANGMIYFISDDGKVYGVK